MMIKALQFVILLAAAGCGGTVESGSPIAETSVSNSECLEQNINFPSKLLTEEMVLELVDTGGKSLETNGSDNNKRTEWNSRDYQWDAGRMGEFQGMKLPLMNSIALNSMEIVKAEDPIENFKSVYKTPTPEERERLTAQMKEQLKTKLDAGEITEEQYNMSEGFTGVFAKLNYVAVNEKVGDIAIWDATRSKLLPSSYGALIVQYGRVRFRVSVDIGGDDDKASMALAIQIARKIISSCR